MNGLSKLRRMHEASTSVASIYKFLHRKTCPSRFSHLVDLTEDELRVAISEMNDHDAVQLYSSYKVAGIHGDRSKEANRVVEKFGDQKPAMKVSKRYLNLFAEDAKKEDWNESEWMIRSDFEAELKKLQENGGCSGCQRTALLRKYLSKLAV